MEKLLWKVLVAVAQGKTTAWAALGQFICEAPWDAVEQATCEVRSWFASGARLFHFITASFSHGQCSASDGDAQVDDNIYCLDLEGPIPEGWPLEILPPAIFSEDIAPSSHAMDPNAAAPSSPAILKDNPALATPSDHGRPTIAGMDIDGDSPGETESLAEKIAAAYNSAYLPTAGSSAGLDQNQLAKGSACLRAGIGAMGSDENQDLVPQRAPSARSGGSTSPNAESQSTGEAIQIDLKDPEESDLTDLDSDPSHHSSSSEEEDTDSDTDSDSGGEALERENLRENLQQKPLTANSKSQQNPRSLVRRPKPPRKTRGANSAHAPHPDSFGFPSAPLCSAPDSGKRKFTHEDPYTGIERPSGSIDLDAAMVRPLSSARNVFDNC